MSSSLVSDIKRASCSFFACIQNCIAPGYQNLENMARPHKLQRNNEMSKSSIDFVKDEGETQHCRYRRERIRFVLHGLKKVDNVCCSCFENVIRFKIAVCKWRTGRQLKQATSQLTY